MKRVYWRPKKISRAAICLVGLFSVAGVYLVEWRTVLVEKPLYDEKIAAAKLAQRSLEVIRQERLARGHAIDLEIDPTGSGILGADATSITSIAGHLRSKQATANPNLAAAVYQMLAEAGVERGDCVAVGWTGSLPGLNVALCAALETLGAEPLIVASAASSQYGANFPDLLWIDMERELHARGLISFRTAACSIGGYEDRGGGMSDEALGLIRAAIDRNGLEFVPAHDFANSIDQRMQLYHDLSGGRPIKAYVNVGGGTISVGRALGKKLYEPGLNLQPPPGALAIDSVMTRFMKEGVPLVHLSEALDVAEQHGLPKTLAAVPPVGDGGVYGERRYSRWLAVLVLGGIVASLRLLVWTDLGERVTRTLQLRAGRSPASGAIGEGQIGAELMV